MVVAGSLAVPAAKPSSPAESISNPTVRIEAVPVPLNSWDLTQSAVGDFSYAGGLVLTSRETDELHGLSDLEIAGTDRITAVGDMGVLLEARLVLNGSNRLVGLTDARLSRLTGEDGKPLTDKKSADAEGVALLPSGDRLVSFERRHRIWLYPTGGGPPRPAPMPEAEFPSNGGMEALAADPESGADAYIVGAEVTGDTWLCRLSSPSCIKGPSVELPEGFSLVAFTQLPGTGTAYLLRAFDFLKGSRVSLQICGREKLLARLDLAMPLTVDNFEGVAALPRSDGTVRFYLISDDNASVLQRTLLLAFDWRPR